MTCRVEQQRVICEESSHSSSSGRNVFVVDNTKKVRLYSCTESATTFPSAANQRVIMQLENQKHCVTGLV